MPRRVKTNVDAKKTAQKRIKLTRESDSKTPKWRIPRITVETEIPEIRISTPTAVEKQKVSALMVQLEAKRDIPSEQYDLPVTFDQSGHILTLRQMLQSGACALSLSSLEPKKLVELTSQRIAAKPDFEIAMVGAGLVNKARALKEVAAQSDVGRLLVEIEQRVIQRVLNRATQ